MPLNSCKLKRSGLPSGNDNANSDDNAPSPGGNTVEWVRGMIFRLLRAMESAGCRKDATRQA